MDFKNVDLPAMLAPETKQRFWSLIKLMSFFTGSLSKGWKKPSNLIVGCYESINTGNPSPFSVATLAMEI